ncbi:hypothetical protein N2599_23750 (plasmid) [Rhizobium sullae]|uniref:Uncharacterized protein n=1 Tax=Rhizobium sullae TaxID=50338 RepID=A0ABY5XUG8_RHISU|nr:hypothetical protein [Rhizobium sullae]UWU18269.1 hypothetical protein N2599_23750 [Rhizobium sullae]
MFPFGNVQFALLALRLPSTADVDASLADQVARTPRMKKPLFGSAGIWARSMLRS